MIRVLCVLLIVCMVFSLSFSFDSIVDFYGDILYVARKSFDKVSKIVGASIFKKDVDISYNLDDVFEGYTILEILNKTYNINKDNVVSLGYDYIEAENVMKFKLLDSNVYRVIYDDDTYSYALLLTIECKYLDLGSYYNTNVDVMWVAPFNSVTESDIDYSHYDFDFGMFVTGDFISKDILTNFYIYYSDYSLYPIYSWENIYYKDNSIFNIFITPDIKEVVVDYSFSLDSFLNSMVENLKGES